jgi:hypothetical protein
VIANLVAELALSAVATSRAQFRREAVAEVRFSALAQIVLRFVAETALTLEALGTLSRRQIIAAVEVLEATAVAESRLAAVEQVAAVLALEALATRGYRLTAETETAFFAELAHTQRHWAEAIASFALADELSFGARFTVVAEAGVVLAAEATSTAAFLQLVEAGFTVTASLRLGNETFVAWVVNTESDAVSRYTGYDFNSMWDYDGRQFALKDDGLYELSGDDDAGNPIPWQLRTGLLDFGSPQRKRAPLMYLAWSSTGQAYLKVAVTSPQGRKEVHWYTLGTRTAEAPREEVCPIGKGLESVFYQFTLEAIDGARVDVDSLRYVPLLTGRRS